MKIGIDISQTAFQGSGVCRYMENLVTALVTHDGTNDYIFFFSSLRQRPSQRIKDAIGKHKLVQLRLPPTVLDLIWNRLHIVPIETFTGDLDLFISSDWTEPPVRTAKKITIIHDVMLYRYPETLNTQIVEVQKRRLNWVKKESTMVVCDSNTTLEDVHEFLGIDRSKLCVVYPAVKLFSAQVTSTEKPFIFSIGKQEPRKNIQRLVNAFHSISDDSIELRIAGSDGWGKDLKLPHDERIKNIGFITDLDLSKFYQTALCLVYPSLYEGFGYPVIEAMLSGCPVITSNSSSLKEIAGDSALLVDPTSEESLAKAIQTVLHNKSLRKELIIKGKKRAQNFSLEQFANHMLSVIKTVV